MKFKFIYAIVIASVFMLGSAVAADMMKPPFGSADDIAYAKDLWKKMEAKGLNSTPANLYVGGPPHGKVREVIEGTIDGKRVIVKRNYGGKGVSLASVMKNRGMYLKAITVMAKREKGYDSDNADWFWVKYAPDGTIMQNPKKMALAGKVAKGQPQGCIACHSSASGNDLVFVHNKEANAEVVYVIAIQ
uniref:cytochrome P460 family protein n=1 Tax=Sulfurimonas sp. TaxID=2022749 RepID=UPI0026398212